MTLRTHAILCAILVAIVLLGAYFAKAANTQPPGSTGNIITNGGNGHYGAYGVGSGLAVVGGNLTSTSTGAAAPSGVYPQIQFNGGSGNFSPLVMDTMAAYEAHNTVSNGLSYDPRDPTYGAICGGYNTFAGDGSTTIFTYTIPFTGSSSTDNSNFMVFYEPTNGTGSATILNTSQFSVTGVNSGSGGTITLNSAPPSSNTLIVIHDDGPGIVSATTAAASSGGYVSVPDGCTIYSSQINGTQLAEGAQVIGQGFTPNYNFQGMGIKPILRVVAPTGSAPNFGFNVTGKNQQFFEGFEITANVPGLNSLGFLAVPVLIGANGPSGAGGGEIPGITAQYLTFNYGTVGFGAPIGGNSNYIFSTLRFNNFIGNTAGVYGPLSDAVIVGNDFVSNGAFGSYGSAGGMVIGPQEGAPGPSSASRIENNRFEFNLEGVVTQSAQLINFEGNQFDGNTACGLDLGGYWNQINLTGGWFRGNANGGSGGPGTTTAGRDADVCFNSTNSASGGFHDSNVVFITNYNEGDTEPLGTDGATTPPYVLDVSTTGAYNNDIEFNGGSAYFNSTITGNNASVTDFAIYRNGRPEKLKYNLFGQAVQGNLVNGQFPALARGLSSDTWTSYNVFGDIVSYGAQLGVSFAYPTIVNNTLNANIDFYTDTSNYSDYECDIVNAYIFPNYNPSQQGNPLVTWLPNVNDPGYGGSGGSSAHEADAASCRLAGLTWMSIPSTYKSYAQAATTTGSWGNFAGYGGAIGSTSTTQNSALTFTVTTTSVAYVNYELQATATGVASGGVFTVSVDGALAATVSAGGNGTWTYSSACSGLCPTSEAPAAVRIPIQGAPNQQHEIQTEVISSTSTANPVTILGVYVPPGKPYVGGNPTVFLAGQLYQYNDAQEPWTTQYNTDEMTQANQLLGDGLAVNFVNIRNYVNSTTDMQSAHPLDPSSSGQQHISDAFGGVIQYTTNPNVPLLDPRSFGAQCNTKYFDNRGAASGYIGSTTSGSPIISVSNYSFVNAPTPIGDIGKTVTINCNGETDLGASTTILSVTSTGSAVLNENMGSTCTSDAYVQFGYNDTAGFQNAIRTAQTTGQGVLVPNNCLVGNLHAVAGVNLWGWAGASGYGYPKSSGSNIPYGVVPVMYTTQNGSADDPLYGIDISGVDSFGLHNFEMRGLTFPYICPPSGPINYGGTACTGRHPNLVSSLVGTTTGTLNSADAVYLDHMTFQQAPVGFGLALTVTSGSGGVGHISGGSLGSHFIQNGINFYVPTLQDWHAVDDDMEGGFAADLYLGPPVGGTYAPVSSHFDNLREEDGYFGIVCDQCSGIQFVNNQIQFENNSPGYMSPASVVISGGTGITFTGGMIQNGTFNPSGTGAQLSGAENITFDNVSFINNQYPLGATITGATQSSNIEIRGGMVNYQQDNGQSITAIANWGSVPAPVKFIVDPIDENLLRLGDPNFTVVATGQIGMGTTSPTPGMGLDLLSDTTTVNSSLGLPSGYSANRPTSGVSGMIRYNLNARGVEAYTDTNWNMLGVVPQNIGGLVLTNDATTPNTTIDINSGSVASDDNLAMMYFQYPLTKTTSGFAAGPAAGCLDTGSITTSTFYNVFAIGGGNLAPDILCSTSQNPVVPAGYSVKKRLNCGFKTDGSSHILPFTQIGNICWWGTPTLDINTALGTTATQLETLNVPSGVKVQPICGYSLSGNGNAALLFSPDTTPAAATTTSPFTASPGYSLLASSTTGGPANSTCPFVTTNTSSQIGLELALSTTTTVAIVTQGWQEIPQPRSVGVLQIDGTASAMISSTTGTITLSTQASNDLILLYSYANVSAGGLAISSISDGDSLSWTRRHTLTAGGQSLDEWYALTTTPLAADVITVTYASVPRQNQIWVLGISGVNTSTPFDPNGSLPALADIAAGSPGALTATTTTSKKIDMLVAGMAVGGISTSTTGVGFSRPSGFSALFPPYLAPTPPGNNPQYYIDSAFLTVSGTLSGSPLTYVTTSTSGGINALLNIDAIQAGGQ
jgi:hypothetical protein